MFHLPVPLKEGDIVAHRLDAKDHCVFVIYLNSYLAHVLLDVRTLNKVPMGKLLRNFAYFWHHVLSNNLVLIFKNFVLTEEWSKSTLSTQFKKLINIPRRFVNHSSKMVMHHIEGFPYLDILESLTTFPEKISSNSKSSVHKLPTLD